MRIHEIINQRREAQHLAPLAYDTSLAALAADHSQDMGQHSYFGHINFRGENASQRAKAAGLTTQKQKGDRVITGIAENIYRIPMYSWVVRWRGNTYHWKTVDEIAQSVVSGWMASPGHRRNLLSPDAERHGLGIYIAADNNIYVTQDLW
ncbi:MAG: CAP domain-containing protein [Candidatus Marinimicrobia bacterium]|nr:CAP domain-containing protein [Candidatus Neomarinimicrobiota bacterium]MCF7829478.1 CAP domain-containing protein [Candidatus Neomarinimicrobiota bacterium]MCF7880124.1 CAP domain-containing protein [Candidatus Neomarinimicrobiota bacterium]